MTSSSCCNALWFCNRQTCRILGRLLFSLEIPPGEFSFTLPFLKIKKSSLPHGKTDRFEFTFFESDQLHRKETEKTGVHKNITSVFRSSASSRQEKTLHDIVREGFARSPRASASRLRYRINFFPFLFALEFQTVSVWLARCVFKSITWQAYILHARESILQGRQRRDGFFRQPKYALWCFAALFSLLAGMKY